MVNLMLLTSKYFNYANKVLAGNITAGKHIKKACDRMVEWLDKDDYEFRTDKADRVYNFCYHLTHGKNSHLNIELQEWQLFILYMVFGWYHKGTDERVIHNLYIEVARKNGKSTLISLLALYMMMGDEEYQSEVDIVANSHKQAQILYKMSSDYCESIDPKGKYFKRYRDNIQFEKTKSKIQVLASDTKTLDGYNSYCFIQDEVHEAPNDLLYNVLKTSQASRTNPLGILITTAGLNMDSFCYSYRQNVLDITYGLKKDDSTFGLIYTLDDEDDYRNPEVWIKSNPNLGVSVRHKYLEEQVLQADNNPSLSANIQTKNFNIWSQTLEVWIPDEYICSASQQEVPISFFYNKDTHIGVDLAAVSDLTAVSLMTFWDGKYYYHTEYYIPSSCLSHNYNMVKYREWKNEKYLNVVPGNITDYDVIADDITKWRSEGVNITNIYYDPWNSVQWAIDMTNRGFMLTPFSQTVGNFNRGTKEFERQVKSGNVIIDKNPITRYCFANATLRVDYNSNCKPQKSGSENNKIDGVISMVQALGGYLTNPQYTAMV